MSNRFYPPSPDDPTVQDPRVTYGASQQAHYPDDPTAQDPRAMYGANQQQVESRAEYVEDKNLMRANVRYWITRIVYFVLGVLEVIMALRFVFRLLGAHQDNDFVVFLYNLSHVSVYPFNGIFNDQTIGNTSVFEVSTLVAMLIYALIAWGLVSLGKVIFAPSLTNEQRAVMSRRSRNTP